MKRIESNFKLLLDESSFSFIGEEILKQNGYKKAGVDHFKQKHNNYIGTFRLNVLLQKGVCFTIDSFLFTVTDVHISFDCNMRINHVTYICKPGANVIH